MASFRSVRASRELPSVVATPEVAVRGGAGVPAAPAALESIDRLSDEGRHAEALHALLLEAIADVRRRRRDALPDDLTSREILESAGLSAIPGGALAALVRSVELTLFGGRLADRGGYLEARARFLELRGALSGRTA